MTCFYPFQKEKSIYHPQQVQDCFTRAGCKPVASSSSVGTSSFSQGWAARSNSPEQPGTHQPHPSLEVLVEGREVRRGTQTGHFSPGNRSQGPPQQFSAEQHGASCCTGGLMRGSQCEQVWAPLMINRQDLIKCLLVYNLLAA